MDHGQLIFYFTYIFIYISFFCLVSVLDKNVEQSATLIIQTVGQYTFYSCTCTMRLGGGMLPGRVLKLTPTPPS